MIISHKHKFIFIKTKKTAGTSIEIMLSKYCGEEDIITPITKEDELIRKSLGYKTAQNYKYTIGKKEIEFFSHISAKKIKEFIGEKIWDEYYKFTFERNPWEKVISFYFWEHKYAPRPNISEFIHSKDLKRLFFGKDALYLIDNKISVDRVCLYENLNKELEDILIRLKIQESEIILPNSKTKYRKDKRNYKEILSNNDIKYISSLFSLEVDSFYSHFQKEKGL